VSGKMIDFINGKYVPVSESSSNIRKVLHSVAGGFAGTTGSLQRFVRLTAQSEIFLDSRQENFTGSNGFKIQRIGSYGYTDSRYKMSSIKMRRDSYGQFRDLLEQGKESAFSPTGIGLAVRPVEIKFFARSDRDSITSRPTSPELTHSQNLSPYSTSSMPYFDNQTIDRLDNPDITLADVPIV
jgi:hypothetical protein